MRFVKIVTALMLPCVFLSTAAAGSKLFIERRPPQGPAEPSIHIKTVVTASGGRIIPVAGGDDFQAALDQATPGDVIEVEAGSEFVGNFILPAHRDSETAPENGANWIIIRSSLEADLPETGTRITPAHAATLPKLVSANASPVISTEPGAHHYRFTGVEFTTTPEVIFNYGLIRLGNGDEEKITELPHDVILDRCYIHGNAKADLRRGVALNSASTAIIDCYISDCHEVGADSQAICGWNGPGPFKIVNNYLEGAGENVLFGGADARIAGLIPSDIEFRNNHCAKPLSWKADDPAFAGTHWSVKNLFELKNAQRVQIEGNLFENCWVDGQTGYALVFKSVNQDGSAPWSATQDVDFKNNIVRHCGSGVNIQGKAEDQPGGQTKRISIRNNLFEDIGGAIWEGEGVFLKISDSQDVTIDHNTVLQSGNIITAYGEPNQNVVFTNNLVPHNLYGVKGDSASTGGGTLASYFPGIVFKRNLIVGSGVSTYPSKNFYPASLDDIGFVDRAKGNYRLGPSSPYKNSGTKGRDVGADIDAIETAICCAGR